MQSLNKFTRLALSVAIVPVLTFGTLAMAQNPVGGDKQSEQQRQGVSGYSSDDKSSKQRQKNRSGEQRQMGERFLNNKPSGALYADDVIGKNVKQRQSDDDVGEIQNLVISADGRILGAVIKSGGFLGLGGQDVVLGWDHIKHSVEDGDSVFRVDMDKDSLKGAPKYTRN